jgi:hypothetical protein
MALALLGFVFAAILILNALATHAVLTDELSTHKQRAGQIAVIWLMPLVGALLTLRLKRKEPEKPLGRYREPPDAGDDFGYAHRRRRDKDDAEVQSSEPADGGAND